jgi:hypothetical protein
MDNVVAIDEAAKLLNSSIVFLLKEVFLYHLPLSQNYKEVFFSYTDVTSLLSIHFSYTPLSTMSSPNFSDTM